MLSVLLSLGDGMVFVSFLALLIVLSILYEYVLVSSEN